MTMQIDDIKELMDKMSQTGLTVLEFESEGSRLRLERAATHVVYAEMPAPQGNQALPQPVNTAAAALAEPPAEEKGGQLVLSPVVGIFYAAGSPDSDPFVKVGSPVEKGSPLCIIEAMKLMNEVTSAWDGVVLEILAENGQRVEFGQPLMRIGGN
jgi:acetyl-CoA carboxylase biotin carboxyl carrier protein